VSWHCDGYNAETTYTSGLVAGERAGDDRVSENRIAVAFRSPENQMAVFIEGTPQDLHELLQDALQAVEDAAARS
jgi:hypothetical protein